MEIQKYSDGKLLLTAVWTLSDLYTYLCEWAYEVYDQMGHPALDQTPRAMFVQGLAKGGERSNRGIAYDDVFLKETMPTSRSEKGKIQKGKGIKLFGHYYQNDIFASRELVGQSVPIRYDPFDIGVLYAFVQNQWLPCQSQFYAQLSGRSERELAIITAELRKSAQGDKESRGLSAARLVVCRIKLRFSDSYRFLDTFSVPACSMEEFSCGRIPTVNPCQSPGGLPINLSSLFGFPSTLDLDSIEVHDQTIIVHLHATAPTAACPQCGTAGSRVHSRYQRTIADVAFGGRNLVLKLLVRKWICPEVSCSRHIFAERFPEVVQRYARMTDRLIKALQSAGVITNGADAAQIASSFGVPTTAKTIIRRVLQLPLPSEGSVRKVGIDEWAWKKGQCYGTILVDLEKRRIAQLLAERSVETSKTWLRKHPEIDLISRDRGKLFREAATDGAPQAKQVVDRFHLQKNFAEALEKFFRKQERALKKAMQRSTGKTRSAERTAVPEKVAQERRARHRHQVSMHKRIWKLYRQGYHKEQIAQLVGVSSRRVYRALEQEAPPPPRRRSRSSSIVDPYLAYLASRWNQGCHNVARLYEEIVAEAIYGDAADASDTASSLSSESRTPCLQADNHLGQASFAQRRCAHDGEASTKPYERASGLFGLAHPE